MRPDVFFYDFLPIAIGLFGLIIGSFLNVCIYRLPRNCLSIFAASSHCPECKYDIRWYDNIPVLSYLLLGGRCRHCGHQISLRYPLVEILNALLYLGAYVSLLNSFPVLSRFRIPPGDLMMEPVRMEILLSSNLLVFWGELLLRMTLLSALIVISYIDVQYRIIPDVISMSGILLAVIVGTVFPVHLQFFMGLPEVEVISSSHLRGLLGSILGVISGGGLIYAIKVGGELVFRKPTMGYGDVKFMAATGGFLGWLSPAVVLIFASVTGSIYGILNLLLTDRHYLPFGPFLSMGVALLLLRPELLQEIISLYV